MSFILSDRHLLFAQSLAAGESPSSAYRMSFDCSGLSDVEVSAAASQLARNPDICMAMADFIAKGNDMSSIPPDEILRDSYLKIIRDKGTTDYPSNTSNILRAAKLLTKLDGIDKIPPEKPLTPKEEFSRQVLEQMHHYVQAQNEKARAREENTKT